MIYIILIFLLFLAFMLSSMYLGYHKYHSKHVIHALNFSRKLLRMADKRVYWRSVHRNLPEIQKLVKLSKKGLLHSVFSYEEYRKYIAYDIRNINMMRRELQEKEV